MAHYPLDSLRHLLHPRANMARDQRKQFRVSDIILGVLLLVAALVLLVEGISYLVSAMQVENLGSLK